MNNEKSIAVVIPCLNEEKSIAQVVTGFKQVLPEANIYVYDNMSTDKTVEVASSSGATVRIVQKKGKGNVFWKAFSDIQEELIFVVDGDNTYDPSAAPVMIKLLNEKHLEMVVGVRKSSGDDEYRFGHKFGNKILTTFVNKIFGAKNGDMLSGYRLFTRRFIKTFPIISEGFEIESEITIHALQLGLPYGEIDTSYFSRHVESESKLRTYSDGFYILKMILLLAKDIKPFQFFMSIALVFLLTAFALAYPVIETYLETQVVYRIPTLILVSILTLSSALSFLAAVILDSIARGRLENKKNLFLSFKEGKQ